MSRSFYCNNCGKKVNRSALKCPSCGRYFGAVLCPKCGFSGEESLFVNGCPACGYLTGDEKNKEDYKNPKVRQKRTLLNLPPLFFAIGIAVLVLLLWLLISFL